MNPTQAIQQLRDVIRRQHKSLSTEGSYVYWLKRYMTSIKHLAQTQTSEQKAEFFLNQLANDRDIAAATQHQAFNAIAFFYKVVLRKPLQNVDALRVSRPVHLRHAPSIADVRSLLQNVPNQAGYPTNLVARLLYGCGLRVTEPLNLRIKDVNLDRSTFAIRDAKGGKDRLIPVPLSLKPEIAQQMQFAKSIWLHDQQNRIPLQIPEKLGQKYPEYQFSWFWAWLFPARNTCSHPRTRQIVRFHMHEANVQRAIKTTRRKLGIMVLPHELRHGYATHALEQGANPRAIQEVMGHKSIETTMKYLHADSLSVRSPLDLVMGGQLQCTIPKDSLHDSK
jgi:integron integrase